MRPRRNSHTRSTGPLRRIRLRQDRRTARPTGPTEGLQFEVLDFDKGDARHAGEVRDVLAPAGRPIGPCDALIAGQAKARGLTLITHNTSEFTRVDIHVEDGEI